MKKLFLVFVLLLAGVSASANPQATKANILKNIAIARTWSMLPRTLATFDDMSMTIAEANNLSQPQLDILYMLTQRETLRYCGREDTDFSSLTALIVNKKNMTNDQQDILLALYRTPRSNDLIEIVVATEVLSKDTISQEVKTQVMWQIANAAYGNNRLDTTDIIHTLSAN